MTAMADVTRVLIVEDDDGHAALIRIAFEDDVRAFDVNIVPTLDGAQAFLTDHHVDIVITDFRLADGEGTALLGGRDLGAPYPVIMMTGQGDETVAVEAMKAGAFDYLVKSPEILEQMPHIALRALREWRNVQGRHAVEARLRESESHLRAIVDTAPVAIIVKDRGGRISEANDVFCRWVMKNRSEIIGATVDDIFPEDPRVCTYIKSLDQRILDGEEGIDEQLELSLNHREILYISIMQTPIRDADDQVTAILGVIVDITDQVVHQVEKEALQRQLYESQKLKALGQMAGGIAHDFNNILGAILGFASFIADDAAEGSSEQRFATRILQASDRAKHLIAQILTFSRRAEPQFRGVDIDNIFDETEGLLRASLPATTELRFENACGRQSILADPTQLNQILVNLCVNANDALSGRYGLISVIANPTSVEDFDANRKVHGVTDKAGRYRLVTGELDPDRSYVSLSVADTGSGMRPDIMDRIFDPFFTTKSEDRGTGLGLSAVHGIVLNHDGGLIVDSGVDDGSCFSIFLPVTEDQDVLPEASAAPTALSGEARILVVDDDIDFGDMVSTGLERQGFTVAVCDDPLVALDIFREAPDAWDAVVSDQTMPKMTGNELIAEMKRLRPDLPCIICSGFSPDFSAELAAAAGIDGFLKKPVKPADLAAQLSNLL